MKLWFNHLSGQKKILLGSVILITLVILIVGYFLEPKEKKLSLADFSYNSTIKQIAPRLGVTGKALAKELKLPLSVDKNKSISALGVKKSVFEHAIVHLLSHKDSYLKYYLYFSLSLFAFFYLVYLGRVEEKKFSYPLGVYYFVLVISVIFAGFVLGKSPNPMEGAVKVFKSMVGLYPDSLVKVVAFVFFIFLAWLGNKIICGWACPFGALEELLFSLPFFQKIKRKIKVPFWFSNSVRGILFLVMLLFLFGLVGGKKGMVIYHYINPFNLFNWDFDPISIGYTVGIVFILSLFIYRPFCQFICPFGFLSWFIEKISFSKVKIDYSKCTKCMACVKICPTDAMKGKVEQKKWVADCFSCSRCLKICPEDAILYTSKRINKNIKN